MQGTSEERDAEYSKYFVERTSEATPQTLAGAISRKRC